MAKIMDATETTTQRNGTWEPSVREQKCVLTISELVSDIRAFELQIAYYERRIIQKRIAIEEIVQSAQCQADADNPPMPEETAPANNGEYLKKSVRELIEIVLPEMNGKDFSLADLRAKLREKFPLYSIEKLKTGVSSACEVFFRKDMLERAGPGLLKKKGRP